MLDVGEPVRFILMCYAARLILCVKYGSALCSLFIWD